jgi:hypothetical protein
MPWSPKQMKSIRARAHGWKGKGAFQNISKKKGQEMEEEGTKPDAKMQAKALRKGK